MHPDCELLFLFDNSQNHHKKAPDGLDADDMNLNPGGKKNLIEMEEVGCFGNRTRKYCCARYVMRNQPDLLAQREWLREVFEDAGCKIMYYPKYHCELNFIDWGNGLGLYKTIRTQTLHLFI